MRIACFGDSWTAGYGIEGTRSWCSVLDKCLPNGNTYNFGQSGCSNQRIFDLYQKHGRYYDTLIFCWTGITRLETPKGMMDFSYVEDHLIKYREKFFSQFTLQDLFKKWEDLIIQINEENPNKRILHFSVFGEVPTQYIENFYKPSMFEYLAEKQGNIFKYNIPIFEFDWLNENNLPLTETFAKKYCSTTLRSPNTKQNLNDTFLRNWKKANIERDLIRPGKYFLNDGHPNGRGHKLWAKHIETILNVA